MRRVAGMTSRRLLIFIAALLAGLAAGAATATAPPAAAETPATAGPAGT
jgi:hypothetical protein